MSRSISKPGEPGHVRFLSGGGRLGEMIAAYDWSRTALGPIESWPQILRTTIALILRSPVPIVTLWGEPGVMIYNDAYSGFAGGRHPFLLGSNVREGWPEVADFNDNVMRIGLAGGTLSYQDQELTLFRSGVPEQVWMNLDYSPILDEDGVPVGVIAIVVETSRKVRAERWLSGERERLRRMFEQAPGFMALTLGHEHVFELTNPAYQQLIGHRDVIGRKVREALPELDGQGLLEPLDRAFRTGEPFSFSAKPILLQRTPGAEPQRRYVDLVYQPIRDLSGAIVGIFSQGADVTERVEAEQASEASEAQFQMLAQEVPNHVWSALPDGHVEWFNQRTYDYSGAAPGTLEGSGWTSITHPEDLARAERQWSEARSVGTAYEIEIRMRRSDGVYRWHLSRGAPLRDQHGAVIRWIGTNTDIEDQKSIAETLAHLNETLEQQVAERTAERDRVWRNSRDLLAVIAADGTFRTVNPAWTQILGHDPAEVAGHSFRDFIWPEDAGRTVTALAEANSGGNLTNFENRFRHKDGTPRWISWHTTREGKLIYAYGRHITAEKEQADALHRAEEALRQAQKMEAIGQLTGGLAHDFNNLLAGISGSLELLQTRMSQGRLSDLDRYIGAAQGAAKRAAALTHRLLAFARRQTLDPRPTDVNRLVTGMEELIRRTVGPEIALEVVAAGGLWTTLVDPNQLENALLNLCINARDAMPNGGRLTIETGNRWLDEHVSRERNLTPGQYVSLCVSDTGTGMTPEVIKRAFDPFFTTKPIGQGTGLGLSMIYGFARQSGGEVRIYSEVGEGTMVCLYLPRHYAEAEQAEALPSLPAPPRAERGETVLIVDDEPTVRMLVAEVLQDLGYTALEAADSAAGLRLLQSGARIDLLVTDVGLPGGMNGRQMADAGRAVRPDLKVLFITGYAENAVLGHGQLEPGMQVVTKPFVIDTLAGRIKELIAGT